MRRCLAARECSALRREMTSRKLAPLRRCVSAILLLRARLVRCHDAPTLYPLHRRGETVCNGLFWRRWQTLQKSKVESGAEFVRPIFASGPSGCVWRDECNISGTRRRCSRQRRFSQRHCVVRAETRRKNRFESLIDTKPIQFHQLIHLFAI